MNKLLLIGLSIAVLALLLIACGKNAAMDDSGDAAAGGTMPESGNDGTVQNSANAADDGNSMIAPDTIEDSGEIIEGDSSDGTIENTGNVVEDSGQTEGLGSSYPEVSQEELDQLKADLNGLNPEDLNAFS